MWRRKVIAYLANDPSVADDYQGAIKLGIERACKEHDLDLWVYCGRPKWSETGTQDRLYEFFYGKRVDGIVLCAATIILSCPLAEFIAEMRRRYSVPVVSVGQRSETAASVAVDNSRGSARLVEHLVTVHGHRKFVYISGPRGHQEAEKRLHATIGALSRRGITLTPDAVRYGDFSSVSGQAAAKDLLRNQYGFDVLVAANDVMAVSALEVLREEGLHCPDQVAVAGFDDALSGRLCQPPLTTVRQPLMGMGMVAVKQIVEMWHGGSSTVETVLDTDLVIRESCGCQPTIVVATEKTEGEGVTTNPENALAQTLVGLIVDAQERKRWARKLLQSIDHEQAGLAGSLVRTFDSLVTELRVGHVAVHDLQRIYAAILTAVSQHPAHARVDSALHATEALVAMHAYRYPAEKQLNSELLLDDLCAVWEMLGTALTMAELKVALLAGFARLEIRDAFIANYAPGDTEHLVPFVCVQGGAAVELPADPYPVELLMPDGLFVGNRRRTLTIMPLSYKTERLGVSVFDLPRQLDLYRILREHISGALKVVRLHQDTAQ